MEEAKKKKIRIGTRKSQLAMVQTEIVADRIRNAFKEIQIEIVPISTKGDENLHRSLASFGGKGVFTRELEEAMREGRIDFAVHSAKDLPMDLPEGLCIGAALGRGDVRDVLVTATGTEVKKLEPGSVIGTSSLRRELQIMKINPYVKVRMLRGNVQTRLNRLKAGDYDGIILAAAGLERLGCLKEEGLHYEYLDTSCFLPAAGQGILAVEARENEWREVLEQINSKEAYCMLEAERSFLRKIGGGCNAPAAAYSRIEDGRIIMDAMYAKDGKNIRYFSETADIEDNIRLAERIAQELNKGKVYLVGAGPGDSDLITRKGLECIKKADVIVYDSLAADSLLNEGRDDAELIYAGKRASNHHMPQEEMNLLLIEKAMEGKEVVRLKGGDPFIFGRGSEEARALRAEGIEFEIIPGISSSHSVPAYAGIPVTHRGIASSFHVITGHESEGKKESALNYSILAKEEGTLVFMMGLKHLPGIVRQLIENGKPEDTPAAVIQEGTTARQKKASGTLKTIEERCKEAGIQTPAVILVGETASLEEELDWYGKGPLCGIRVLITATRETTAKMAEKIKELGGEPVEFSLIQTHFCGEACLEKEINRIEEYSWIVFTSKNGVHYFFETMKNKGIDIRKFCRIKFAVIGEGTKEALEDKGIFAECVPGEYSSKGLGEALIPMLSKKDRVLLLRAKEASQVFINCLKQAEIGYTDLGIYETVCDYRKMTELSRIVNEMDYIIFASSSAVKAFASMSEFEKIDRVAPKVICIGPVTRDTAVSCGLSVYDTAVTYDVNGMIQCLLKDKKGRKEE